MSTKTLEYRMYGLVPYNISPIQQAIQFGHAVQEYNNYAFSNMLRSKYDTDEDKVLANAFHKWRKEDKTFIILNGGTTNNRMLETPILKENDCNTYFKGSLNNYLEQLIYNNIKTAVFYEPDLGDQLTAVVFLVDERVWNKKKYPNFIPTNGLIRDDRLQTGFDSWLQSIGGEKNLFLREFLKYFKLA